MWQPVASCDTDAIAWLRNAGWPEDESKVMVDDTDHLEKDTKWQMITDGKHVGDNHTDW